VLAGIRPNSWVDTLCMVGGLVACRYELLIGMVLILRVRRDPGLGPITGRGFQSLILPSITVGLFIAGGFARLCVPRSSRR